MLRIMTTAIAALALTAACASGPDDEYEKTKKGAAVGAAAGAVAGAVIGNQSGNPRTGAAVGAAVGAGVGAAVGRRMDKQQQELERIEGIEVSRPAEDQLDVVVKNEILFDFDSAALRPASRTTLSEVASVLREYPDTTIVVEGHTDAVGSDRYNLDLSQKRARSVADYLNAQGVDASRLRTVGFGKTQPRASNESPEGRQLNRRVELKIKATQS